MGLISKADFAKKHNFSASYVSKLIRQGKLQTTAEKMLDEDAAEYDLIASSDAFRPKFSKAPQSQHSPDVKGIASVQQRYVQAKLDNEIEKGRLLRLEAEEKERNLIPASEVENTLFTVGRVIRDTMMNIPDRVSTLLANINDAREIHKILSLEIRSSLEELSRGR